MSTPSARLNPFPGLRPFETRDKYLYFGREEQTAALLSRLRERRFLAVVGTSGSGKSSLVRAGLIPGLHGGFMAGAGPNWKIAVMRPGGDPTGNLAQALDRLDLLEDPVGGEAFIRTTLSRSAFGLTEFVQQAGMPGRYNLLVVVDQFEEIFRFRERNRSLEEEAGGFVRLLLEATRQREHPIYVVLTMRSDFLGDCAEFSGLAEAINEGEYLVPRMKRDQYRLAIEGPVRVGGGRISGRLVQRLLNDMGSNPDQLPVLQHALMRTWNHWLGVRVGDQPMDVEHYDAVGTITEALSRHADEVYRGLTGEPERVLAARVFKALTEAGSGNRGMRRPTRLGVLAEISGVPIAALAPVIDPFREPGRTFLTPPIVAEDSETEVEADSGCGRDSPERASFDASTVIDISHESLMRVWTRLQGWVREEAVSASIYRRLAESARLRAEGRFDLLRDPELQLAMNWRAENEPTAAWADRYAAGFDQAIALLESSARARDEARRAVIHRRRVLFTAVSVVACVFFVLWIYAMIQHRRANSRWLSMRANDEIGKDPRESVLLARAAIRESPLKESIAMLRSAVWDSRLVKDDWLLPEGAIHGASLNPDGSRFVVLIDSNAFVLSLQSRPPIAQLAVHSGRVHVADFSADGGRLLTAGEDGKGVIWDTSNWRPRVELRGHESSIARGHFSRSGAHAVTAGVDGTSRVWDVATGVEVARLTPGTGESMDNEVRSAAFNRHGDLLALGLSGGGISIWDWKTTTRLWTGEHAAHTHVLDLQFSPDDRFLASAGNDGLVVIWEGTGDAWQRRSHFGTAGSPGAPERIWSLDFSPGGRLIVTANDQRLAQVWDWPTGSLLFNLRHPQESPGRQSVVSAAFSSDGNRILTATSLGMLRIWDPGVRELPATMDWPSDRWNDVVWAAFAPAGDRLVLGDGSMNAYVVRYPEGGIVATLSGHLGAAKAATFDPRRQRLVTAGGDQRLGVWDTTAWSHVRWVDCTNSAEAGMVFSPDGRWLAVARAKSVRILETETWTEQISLTAHTSPVLSVRFSPDGSLLASGGEDSRLFAWRVPDWSLLASNGVAHGAHVGAVAFHPREPMLGTASDEIRLLHWNDSVRDREEMGRARTGATLFQALAFAPSGECAVSTDEDGHLGLWDVAMHRMVGVVPSSRHGGRIVVLFTPNGRELLTMGDAGLGLVYESKVWATSRELVTEVDVRWGPARPHP